MGDQEEKVFVRKATGLIREWSSWDTFMYSALTAIILTTGSFTYFWAPWAFPGGGGNGMAIGILVCAIIGGFSSILAIGVLLAASMPRSGGDYVFQSRILHGSIGFVFALGFIIPFVMYWMALAGWSLSAQGLSPMFSFFGYMWNNAGLLNAATWFASTNGVFIVSVITTLICALTLMPGMKFYLRLQWILFVLLVASIAVTIILCFTFSPGQFPSTLNSFMLKVAPGTPNYYQYIIDAARTSGFNTNVGYNVYDTFGVVTLAWWALAWSALWTTPNLGEIKRADSVKRLSWIFFGVLAFATIAMVLTALGTTRVAGWDFLSSQSWAYFNGSSLIPFPANNLFVAALLTTSPIIIGIIFFGFIANAIQLNYNCYIGSTRMMLAASFDRSLPEWFAGVSKKWHSPINAIIAFAVGSIIMEVGWGYLGWGKYMIASMMTAGFVHFFSNVAAVAFPYRMPKLYAGSPASKYKIGRIPLIVIAGTIGIVFESVMLWYYFTEPKLFTSDPGSLAFIIAVYLVLFAYYWINRWYKKGKGIEIDTAYKEVPPE